MHIWLCQGACVLPFWGLEVFYHVLFWGAMSRFVVLSGFFASVTTTECKSGV